MRRTVVTKEYLATEDPVICLDRRLHNRELEPGQVQHALSTWRPAPVYDVGVPPVVVPIGKQMWGEKPGGLVGETRRGYVGQPKGNRQILEGRVWRKNMLRFENVDLFLDICHG